MGSVGSTIMGGDIGSVLGLQGTIAGAVAGASMPGMPSLPGLGGDIGFNNKFDPGNINVTPQAGLQGQINQSQAGFNALAPQQQQLAQALLAQSQGQGPNPAQAMLNQATDRNVREGASLISSQKGINPGLAGRQAAEMATNANQQAAGQGAIMGAQQQLGAQSALGGLYGQMGQQQLGYQSTLQNALANQNQQSLQAQIAPMQARAGVAQSNADMSGKMFGGAMQGGGAALGSFLAASTGAYVGGQANVPGDSPANDTVLAKLSPGEIVIPRSKAGDPEAAKAFVEHLLERKKKRSA